MTGMAASVVRRVWPGFVAGSLVLAAVRGFVPQDSAFAMLSAGFYPLLTIAAIIVGVRLNRPARKLPWLLLLAFMTANIVGNIFYAVSVDGGHVPFPSPSDAFWLAGYAMELTGLMVLVNGMSWRRDRAGILDTLIVTGGLGLGVWLLLLRDLVEPSMPLGVRLVTMAYPLFDLLILAGMIRMCTSSVRRSPAFWQLTAALAIQGLEQAAYLYENSHGGLVHDLGSIYLLFSMLLGCAALHPSMVAFGAKDTRPAGAVTTRRVLLIGSACLLSPLLLIVNGVVDNGRVEWLAASLCCIVVFLLVIARMLGLIRTVQAQSDQLESLAYLDGLTGIANRRAWDAELLRRLAVSGRAGTTLIVGIIDLDHFKRYNDMYGHPAGDALLRDASAAWTEQLRSEDLIARYGGEEFGLILHCRLREAASVMERLREVTPDGQTFSAGLAQWTGEESAAQLTARVDAALYTAKREGRDQYSVTGHPACTDLRSNFLNAAGAEPR
jgi:diguanylate cyclase (GGDEF)-like protein